MSITHARRLNVSVLWRYGYTPRNTPTE